MKEIKTVGIIGFGVMGAAIGISAASSGYNVIFKELNDELVRSMHDKWVTKAMNKKVEKKKMTLDQANEISKRIKGTSKKGKIPISVRDFPGFAINPIFISSYLALNSFHGKCNAATLESISKEVLGLKYGIMWVQNFSGIGTSYHAGNSMYNYLAETDVGFLEVPQPLEHCFRNNEKWNLEDGADIEDKTVRKVVADRLLGAIFTIATHLVDKAVVTEKDLEEGVQIALAWPQGPFTLMNQMGMERVRELIVNVCYTTPLKMPDRFLTSIPAPWDLS